LPLATIAIAVVIGLFVPDDPSVHEENDLPTIVSVAIITVAVLVQMVSAAAGVALVRLVERRAENRLVSS
jgi:hypothetical protein